jgi:ABC-2 type transport system ATP-binding protein
MLKIENLVKDYTSGFLRKRVRVLNDVSFSVNNGEIFGFVGPNGAGKTTTFKVVLGFVSLTGGRVELMGKPIGDVDVKKHIGYLPENPYFFSTWESCMDSIERGWQKGWMNYLRR